jgi:hypothetical protein
METSCAQVLIATCDRAVPRALECPIEKGIRALGAQPVILHRTASHWPIQGGLRRMPRLKIGCLSGSRGQEAWALFICQRRLSWTASWRSRSYRKCHPTIAAPWKDFDRRPGRPPQRRYSRRHHETLRFANIEEMLTSPGLQEAAARAARVYLFDASVLYSALQNRS